MALFLNDEEARDVRELVAEVKAARAEGKKENEGLTKEKIMSEKSMTKRQKLIKENMHLFKGNLSGGKK